MSARRITDLFIAQAAAQRTEREQAGYLLHLPPRGDLVVVGDLHNHRRNFERILSIADLEHHPDRTVILQEIIHGGALGPQGEDTSLDLLVDAVTLARQFPGQVYFLLANHDLAQVQGMPVMKDGYDLVERFDRGFAVRFGAAAKEVLDAFAQLVYTMPVAAISVTGIMLTHSLPNPREMNGFDTKLFGRPLTADDYHRGGSVHRLVWGRNQTADELATLAKAWWADLFICGHQQQDDGYGIIPPNMLILDSCHNHGMILQVDLARQYTLEDLINTCLIPLASIG